MYAVISRYRFRTAPSEELLRRIEDEGVAPITQQPGFRAYSAVRHSATDVTSVYLWESQEAAERGSQAQGAWAKDHLVSEIASAERSVGEVVVERRK